MCSGDAQQLSDGRAVSNWIMVSNSFLAARSFSVGKRLGLFATGGPGVVRMWCWVECFGSAGAPAGRVISENFRNCS